VHEQQQHTTNLAVGNENLAFAEVSLDTGQLFLSRRNQTQRV